MKFNIEVDTEHDSADVVGEALRGKFWKQPYSTTKYGTYRETGCYSSFDYQDDVEELEPEIEERQEHWSGEEWTDRTEWHRARWRDILCRWYWDGDGTIEFHLPDGFVLRNTDCKKTYGWEYEDTQEEDTKDTDEQ